jgi:hypothetical protein
MLPINVQESLRVRQVKLIPHREGWIWQSRSPAFYEYGSPLPTQDAAWNNAAAVLHQQGIVKWQATEAYWVSREVVAVVEVREVDGRSLQVVDSYYVDGRCIAAVELQHCNYGTLGSTISVALQYDGAFKRVMNSSPACIHELCDEDLSLFSRRQGWAPKCIMNAAQRAAVRKQQ